MIFPLLQGVRGRIINQLFTKRFTKLRRAIEWGVPPPLTWMKLLLDGWLKKPLPKWQPCLDALHLSMGRATIVLRHRAAAMREGYSIPLPREWKKQLPPMLQRNKWQNSTAWPSTCSTHSPIEYPRDSWRVSIPEERLERGSKPNLSSLWETTHSIRNATNTMNHIINVPRKIPSFMPAEALSRVHNLHSNMLFYTWILYVFEFLSS